MAFGSNSPVSIAFPFSPPCLAGTFCVLRNSAGINDHASMDKENSMGRGILLWLLGVPIPIIIILALIWH